MLPAPSSPRRTGLAERYRVLLEIGRSLTRTLSLPEVFQQIYREASEVLDTGGFYVSLYDAETDRARVVFYADRGVERHVEIEYRGSDSEVLRRGAAYTFSSRDGSSLLILGDDGSELTRSAVSAPMRYEGQVIGAISTQSYQAGSYGPEDVEMLQGIADMAAVAIENARKVAEIEARRREAERIEEIGRAMAASLDASEVLGKIVDATLELLECDVASVWFLEDDCRVTVAASGGEVAMPEGLSWQLQDEGWARIVESRDPVAIPDLVSSGLVPEEVKSRTLTRSVLLVPLVVEDRMAGALAVGSRESRTFEGDVVLLERLASQASVALENARLHASVQALSLTDPLTHLPNRRQLNIHLQREIAAARRGRNLCLVMFDLDHFKQYNDRLGHQAGDEILRRFAEILEEESRSMNLVARYGGDEFVSVVSETPVDGVRIHAQRVADRIRNDPHLGPEGISVSFGLAAFAPEMEGSDDLIRAADEELYRIKDDRPDPPPRDPPTRLHE